MDRATLQAVGDKLMSDGGRPPGGNQDFNHTHLFLDFVTGCQKKYHTVCTATVLFLGPQSQEHAGVPHASEASCQPEISCLGMKQAERMKKGCRRGPFAQGVELWPTTWFNAA